MIPRITAVLTRLKTDWAAQLQPDAMMAVCQEAGYTAWRDRVLTPVTTIQLFLLQMLHGHTACRHVPHLSGLRFSASAYCQARSKLPRDLLGLLLTRLCTSAQSCIADEGRWHGHRTFFVDGSGCSMPDIPALQQAFGQPTEQRPGCGFPVAKLLGLFHAGTGVLLTLVVAPLLTHDLARVQAVHPSWPAGDVLVADRGLCSSAHLALLVQAGMHAVRRVGARQIVDCTPGRPFVKPSVRRPSAVTGIPRSRWRKALGVDDQLVAWLKPTTCPSWLARETLAALSDSLVLREVRYRMGTPGFRTREITLVTTLLDAETYGVSDLAALYRQRWQVETALAQLKTTMQMEGLHGQTVPGVLKDLTVFTIVYTLVRLVMGQSATLQHLGVERISFVDALRWLGASGTGVPLGALLVNPVRPHRVEPRVKKRRPKSFPFMITPRQELRQHLLQQELRG
jgi:Transposase DDE domain